MTAFFNSLLSVTAGASLLIVVVLALSALLGKRYSTKWRYFAWLFIAIRLIVPFEIPVDASIFTFSVPEESTYVSYTPEQNKTTVTNPDKIVIEPDKSTENITQTPTTTTPTTPPVTIVPSENDNIVIQTSPVQDVIEVNPVKTISYTAIFACIWIIGAVASLVMYVVAHLRFIGNIRLWNRPVTEPWAIEIFKNVKQEMGITKDIKLYRNRSVHSPILAGFFKPMVLIPTRNITENDLYMVLRHELQHYKRHDLWYKLVLVLTGCLHWFNPLVWFMVKRADRDLEISCDEAVVKGTSMEFRRDYCDTILRIIRFDRGRKPALSTGFTTGKKTMKQRFACALDFSKKRTGVILLCFVLCAAILCSTFIACDITKKGPEQYFDSITQEDVNNAIANPDSFTEEELAYYESILDWYEYSIGISGEVSWNDSLDIVGKLVKYYEISPDGFAAFYEKVQNQEAEAVKTSENMMFVPADVVENYIAERFDIDKEAFRNEAWRLDEYEYVEEAYAFNLDMGYGGLYDYSILKVEKSGNIWKFYCSNSYPIYYGNEELYEEDYAVIVVEHNGENNYKFLCAKGFHEDKFASIRAKFEYPFSDGILLAEKGTYAFDESITSENQNAQLASLLYYSARANEGKYSDLSFLIGDADKIDAAISMLGVTTYKEEYSDIWGTLENRAEILPFANENIFIPKEWVEKAIRQIWGDDVEIYHYNSYGWEYKKDGGIYTPKGTETAKYHLYIHSITKTEKGYIAEVSYLYSGNPGVWGNAGGVAYSVEPETYGDIFATPEVVELAKKQSVYLVSAEYDENGSLHLKSSVRVVDERTIADALEGAKELGVSNYIGKNTEVVANTATVVSVDNDLGFENAFAMYPDGYELVNINRLNYFIQEYKENNMGSVLVLKSGSPLPLYAVLLKFNGDNITRQIFYLMNDALVEGEVEIVTLKETETMWFFEGKDKVFDVFPKTDFTPLVFAEAGSMTADEVSQKLENMCTADYKVKYSDDKMVYGHECYYFTYVDNRQMYMGSIYVSKDLQRIFVTEQVNGSSLMLVK